MKELYPEDRIEINASILTTNQKYFKSFPYEEYPLIRMIDAKKVIGYDPTMSSEINNDPHSRQKKFRAKFDFLIDENMNSVNRPEDQLTEQVPSTVTRQTIPKKSKKSESTRDLKIDVKGIIMEPDTNPPVNEFVVKGLVKGGPKDPKGQLHVKDKSKKPNETMNSKMSEKKMEKETEKMENKSEKKPKETEKKKDEKTMEKEVEKKKKKDEKKMESKREKRKEKKTEKMMEKNTEKKTINAKPQPSHVPSHK
jgi:hypothetical protein